MLIAISVFIAASLSSLDAQWEDPDSAWDVDPSDLHWNWDDLADDAPDVPNLPRPHPSRELAQGLLGEYLLDQCTSKNMFAREAGTIAYYCYHGGFDSSLFKELATHPEAATGKASVKLKQGVVKAT